MYQHRNRYANAGPANYARLGLQLSEPDTRDEDAYTRIDEEVRADAAFLLEAAEYVAQDLGDWPTIVATLADLAAPHGLIQQLAEMAPVGALMPHYRDEFAAVARLCNRLRSEREARIATEAQRRFDAPVDGPDGTDFD